MNSTSKAETGEGNAPRDGFSKDAWIDRLIAQHNDAMTTANKYKRERDELLSALKQAYTIINQPCATNSKGPKTLEILQGDCAIARKQIEAAIAKAGGTVAVATGREQ